MEADPPAAHRLPQEIFDLVVGHYSEDTDVLSTLALVSRSWLHSARTHLFAKVTLQAAKAAADPWSDGEGDVNFDPLERVNAGLELVKSSPAIASCIRYVTLNGVHADITVQGFEFLSHLPNLRSLTIFRVSWPDLRPAKVPVQKALSVLASTLESLSFQGIKSASAAELSAFIRACSNIKSVEFACIRWEEDLLISHAPVFRDLAVLWGERPVRLKQITLREMTPSISLRPVLEMLLERDAFELDLEKLVLDWDGTWNGSSLHKTFSRAIGSSLKTLTLDVRVLHNQEPGGIIQLLSLCKQLSSFSLTSIHHQKPLHWFEPVFDSLAEASSSHLKEITLECCLYIDVEENQLLPWAKLDSAVSNTHRFLVFEKLRVIVTDIIWMWRADGWRPHDADMGKAAEDTCRNLEEWMPRAAKAGLLEVVQIHWHSLLRPRIGRM